MIKGKNFFIFIFLGALPCFSSANLVDTNLCAAIFTEKYVAAEFPIPDQKEWHWFQRAITPEKPEHAWIAEPGTLENNVFKSNGLAFSMSVGSANLAGKKEKTGSMKELIEVAKKNAYLTKKPESPAEHENNLNLIMKSEVGAKLVEKDIFILSVFDKSSVALAKSGNPTHMRLRAITSNANSSYECMPKIEYVKISN
ncbi:hypothetical protein [Acidovorax sp. SUPP3334]|uniref:hypothetical protein n=1 Tax=Acidovorax sp. SUPP3334 TaxID=2920881 RepID=UPI0023DE4E2F|nr:hypothetical protein [Acidovorax sp. SUPP3334]GKT26342.1 uncharacterized protein YbfC [Acidovorax sp. SUPP3334]